MSPAARILWLEIPLAIGGAGAAVGGLALVDRGAPFAGAVLFALAVLLALALRHATRREAVHLSTRSTDGGGPVSP